MSITETNKIDIIATHASSSIVKLVITDHLSWEDFDSHAQMLEDKINTYLTFIESGQLNSVQSPRIPSSPELHIVLAVPEIPPQETNSLFDQIRESLKNLRIGFDVEVRESKIDN
jgi:hypothetical protein